MDVLWFIITIFYGEIKIDLRGKILIYLGAPPLNILKTTSGCHQRDV